MMKISRLHLLLLLTLAFNAKATTITFDDLTPGSLIGMRYAADGYVLTGTLGSSIFLNQFYVPSQSSSVWTGSSGIVFGAVGGGITLRSETGLPFDAISIDISRADAYGSSIPLSFAGVRSDGSKVFANYQFSNPRVGINQKFYFGDEFRNLKSVSWYEGAEWQQYDNIELSPAAVVPEPGSLALIGLAAAGLGATRRRKQTT